jgi:hypothetical protein
MDDNGEYFYNGSDEPSGFITMRISRITVAKV